MPRPKGTERRSARPKRPRTTPARRAGKPVPGSSADDRFFRDLVWSMRNGVLAVTHDGRIVVMNESAYRILGLRPRAADIGRTLTDVLGPTHDISRLLSSAFELAHLPNRAELRLKPSGKVIGYTLSQIRNSRGGVTGAALFFKDLTRVEQLEERERLRDRLAALGEMAAAIAHEVKNPLAGIEVMAGVLKRQVPDSADAQTILNDIIHEAKMANAIVQEVLEFVRPIRLEVERVSLGDVLQQAVTMAQAQVPRAGITVDLHVPADLPRLQGDQHQLRQVFVNLLTNAFEAQTGEGAVRIAVTLVAPDDEAATDTMPSPTLQVEVADDGPGVSAEVLDRIFSPFFTTKPQGSGLGLAIVRKIVDAHDGRIVVTSSPAGGTVFHVSLPVTSGVDLFAGGRQGGFSGRL